MTIETKRSADVNISIATFMPDSERIPKLIEVFDKSLKAIRSQWYESNIFTIKDLQPGTYTLRLSLSSGIQKDETFDLKDDEVKEIEINIGYNSPYEQYEWAYLNKNISIESFRDTNFKAIQYNRSQGKLVNGKLWKYNNGSWQQELLPQFMNQIVHGDGNMFECNTNSELSVLEISGEEIPNLYVSLPPGNQVKCLVKLAESSDETIHPIDVTVSTNHFGAETLLTLLTNGAIREAKTLSNATEAEQLLFQKMDNPAMAAIGGYFLLKIGELTRLHDWAYNLAKLFPWLPDGAIIQATQLLNRKEKTDSDINLIRSWLLQAASEGIPVYSEGLRLLEKGLTQLWYHSGKKDSEIEKARERIGNYLEVTDLSQETTSYIGISPSEPGRARGEKIIVTSPTKVNQPTYVPRKNKVTTVTQQKKNSFQKRTQINHR